MKRVIFILLICALLVYPCAWAIEDVTVLKEEVGSKSQQTSSEYLTDLIKKLEDANESTRQEAKKQLSDIIWQESVRPLVDEGSEYEGADILLSDIDGNGTREIIASFSGGWLITGSYMAVVDETLSTIQVIEFEGVGITIGGIEKITDLLGEGEQALKIEGEYSNSAGYNSWIKIYQWGQGKFTEVWSRSIEESWIWDKSVRKFDILIGTFARAKVQIVDIDQDGIREIVRIWELYERNAQWQDLFEWEQKAGHVKVELEMGSSLDGPITTFKTHSVEAKISGIDFDKLISEYEFVYRAKEIFFWNKDFNRYIQYKARITKDTTSDGTSIASGTVVGVLGSDFQKGFDQDLTDVVLLDGRIVSVDKGILERIRSEDERDR